MKSLAFKARRFRRNMAIALVVMTVIGWMLWPSGKNDAASAKPMATATRGDVEETVTAQGKLEPKEYVDVGAQVSGQLQKVYVEIGDTVTKGKLLAEIDPKVYESAMEANEARLKSLNAQIDQQKAQLTLAKQQYERNKQLIKLNAVSKELLEESKASFDVANASLAALKAQAEESLSSLKGAKANLSYTKIYAPMSGTVTAQTTRQGQTINANQTAPNIMQIANLDVMTVKAQVAEADVSRLIAGMEVYFTTLGAGERRWVGTVRQVLPTPETINDVVLYSALVDVENKDRQLMTGMSTQMFFLIGQAKGALTIPATALRKPLPEENSDLGKAFQVELLSDGKAVPRTVFVGLMTRTQAEIKSGLNEGDVVLLPESAPVSKPGANAPRRMMGPRL